MSIERAFGLSLLGAGIALVAICYATGMFASVPAGEHPSETALRREALTLLELRAAELSREIDRAYAVEVRRRQPVSLVTVATGDM